MQYAISANLCEADPAQGIKLKMPKSHGIYTWSEQDIADYEAVHAVGMKLDWRSPWGSSQASVGATFFEWAVNIIHKSMLSVKQQKTGG